MVNFISSTRTYLEYYIGSWGVALLSSFLLVIMVRIIMAFVFNAFKFNLRYRAMQDKDKYYNAQDRVEKYKGYNLFD